MKHVVLAGTPACSVLTVSGRCRSARRMPTSEALQRISYVVGAHKAKTGNQIGGAISN